MRPAGLAAGAGLTCTGVGLVVTAALLAACASPRVATTDPPIAPSEVPEIVKGSGVLSGYLAPEALPDSATLLPPPPSPGTPGAAADEAAHRALAGVRTTARWRVAAADAEVLRFPQAAASFACTLGVPIDATHTPHLLMLMRRTLGDAGLATYSAKARHQRQRPFIALKEASCTPADEVALAQDGSYPSGHASVGWAWGLLLAEMAPERAAALLQRGLDYGESRMVCAVHWASDVQAGRLIGAATLARMRANATFLRQFALARQEVAAARAGGLQPLGCAAP